MATSLAKALFDKGHQLQEEYSTILTQRAANRRSLRDLEEQGMLSEEESDLLFELYPPKKKKGEGDDEGVE